MSNDEDYEDYEDYEDEPQEETRPKRTGFCGLLETIKKRPDRRLF